MVEELDFVSYHYYREPKDFLNAHNQLKSIVKDKPLLLQEYGSSSYDGFWNLYQGSIEEQIDYYTTMQNQLSDAEIPFVFWTLYDFEKVPTDVAGSLHGELESNIISDASILKEIKKKCLNY